MSTRDPWVKPHCAFCGLPPGDLQSLKDDGAACALNRTGGATVAASADGWIEAGLVCQACAGDAPGGKCRNPKCVGGPIVRELVPADGVLEVAPAQPLRYHWDQDTDDTFGFMVGPVPDGEWVKWADVQHLFGVPGTLNDQQEQPR